MRCLQLPLFDELEDARTILIAGAGGGFDVFSGLPLYFGLRQAGKQVHLANLSFSHLEAASGRRLAPAAVEITADSRGTTGYFPEYHLCRWFRGRPTFGCTWRPATPMPSSTTGSRTGSRAPPCLRGRTSSAKTIGGTS